MKRVGCRRIEINNIKAERGLNQFFPLDQINGCLTVSLPAHPGRLLWNDKIAY
jgi:hypothetical protein